MPAHSRSSADRWAAWIEPAARLGRSPASGYILAALVFLVHTWLVWGYTNSWFGDHGRWLHEVERFASGEVPYRDFEWHFPPLALWIVGSAARVVGTDLAPVSAITAAIALVLVMLYVRYVRTVLGRSDALLTAGGLVLALAYACIGSSPLPLGLYTPAALVGACVTAALALLVFAEPGGDSTRRALLIGMLAGLGILSKQDFWMPAAVAATASLFLNTSRRLPRALATLAGFLLVAGAGAVAIGVSAGWSRLVGLPGGHGTFAVSGGRGLPSWERLTVEVLAVCLLVMMVCAAAAIVARSRRWAAVAGLAGLAAVAVAVLHLAMSIHVATAPVPVEGPTPTQGVLAYHVGLQHSLIRPALGLLRGRLLTDSLPAILSPFVLCLVLFHRPVPSGRRRLLLLLAFATSLRLRRAFEHTDWVEFLFGLPVLVLSLDVLFDRMTVVQRGRLRAVVAGAVLLAAPVAYRRLARGPLTPRTFAATATPRGVVHWNTADAGDYRALRAELDAVDPRRTRGLLAFAYTGGFNYFLARHNPSPFTQDFFHSAIPADSALEVLARSRDRLLLIDTRVLPRRFPDGRVHWDRWEQVMAANTYATYDRPRFERLALGCAPVTPSGARPPRFRLLDCGAASRGGTANPRH